MNAHDILRYGHLTLLGTLEGIPESQWEQAGVCGVWSVKNILAHLASYEQLLVEVLGSLSERGPTPLLSLLGEDAVRFNDIQVAERQSLTPSQTLAEYNDLHTQSLTLLARLPAPLLAQPGTLPWYGAEYALDDFLVYSYYGHKREHAAQIALFQDQLRRVSPGAPS